MSYHHLTTYERGRIEALHEVGYSNRNIALLIGRHRSCVDREIKRNTKTIAYQAEVVDGNYQKRRMRCKPNGKWNEDIAGIIEQKLRETWSPEQIANTVTKGKLSFKTIYNWLYQGRLPHVEIKVLRQEGKRRKPAEKHGRFAVGASISKCPIEVKSKEGSLS